MSGKVGPRRHKKNHTKPYSPPGMEAALEDYS